LEIPSIDINPTIFNINDFLKNHEKYKDTLLVAKIKKWDEIKELPLGKIINKITDEHTIKSRTDIILKEHNIKNDSFYDLIILIFLNFNLIISTSDFLINVM